MKKMPIDNGSKFTLRSVHGWTRAVDNKASRRTQLVWLAGLLVATILAVAFLIHVTSHFSADQIHTVIDSTCDVKQVPFPAVSICNLNIVSHKESGPIVDILLKNGVNQKEIEDFMNALPSLDEFLKYRFIVGYKNQTFSNIMNVLRDHYYDIDQIMIELHQKCASLLVYCSFNRLMRRCTDLFKMVETKEGLCCTFNYAALDDLTKDELPATRDPDMEYYDDTPEDYAEQTSEDRNIVATTQFGRKSGLLAVIDVQPEDYPPYSNVPFGAKLLISDPNDYPETSVQLALILTDEAVDIKVSPRVYQSDNAVRRLSIDERGCWFHDEAVLAHTARYSYETCRTECNMWAYKNGCGCVPYKYPKEKNVRTCELKDLPCLINVTEAGRDEQSQSLRLDIEDLNDIADGVARTSCTPPCYVECRDKGYTIRTDIVPLTKHQLTETNIKVFGNLSAVRVYYTQPTCNCYKLELLVNFNDLVATFGGVFSVCIGVSLLTIFEISFLLGSRLLTAVQGTSLAKSKVAVASKDIYNSVNKRKF